MSRHGVYATFRFGTTNLEPVPVDEDVAEALQWAVDEIPRGRTSGLGARILKGGEVELSPDNRDVMLAALAETNVQYALVRILLSQLRAWRGPDRD